MNATDMLPKLEAWRDAMLEMDKQYEALDALLGIAPDRPLTLVIQNLQALATDATAENVGDTGGWLSYYWLECNMGKGLFNGRPGMAEIGGKEYTIRTLKQLARVIVADNRQRAKGS